MIWLWISSGIFAISLAISLLGAPKEIFWNTDALYLPSILIDVIRDGGSLRSWSFAPTPYFFPDLPLVFLFGSLTGNAFGAIFLYAVFQALFFAWALGRYLSAIEPKATKPQSYSLALLSLSFFFLVAERFPLLYNFFLPSLHISAFFAALWIWPFLTREKVRKYLVFPILILFTASDRILVFELFLPAALAWARRYGRWGISFPLISVRFFASGAIGIGLYSFSRIFLSISSPNKIPTGESVTLWWGDLLDSLLTGDLQGIFLVFAILTGLWCLAKSKEWGHGLAFSGYSQILLVFLPPLAGLYAGQNGFKISLPAILMTPALIGVLVAFRNPKFASNARNFALLGSILGLGIFSAWNRGSEAYLHFFEIPKPKEAICLDLLKETESFVFVVSEAQKARRIFAYSEKRVFAYPIDFSTLEGAQTISNREWYLFAPEGPIGVIPEGLGEYRIRSFYGEPSKIVSCPNAAGTVWIYEETSRIREFLQRPFQKTK